MKVMLVINPMSGRHLAPRVQGLAEERARSHGAELEVRTVQGPGDGTRFAQEAVSRGFDRVISAGGDGTLNAVACGLVGTRVPVAVIGLGSGNGYVRSLELPRDPQKAMELALTGEARPVDVCYLNDRLFVGTAGIGFDARVAAAFERSSRGAWNYARIILREVFSAQPMRVVVKANHETIEEQVLMLVFANSREFGNGALISPGSRVDDGMAELRLVRKPPFPALLKAFFQLYAGSVDRSPYLRSIPAREAMVHQAGVLAHLDGESVEVGHELRFRLEPKRLWVVR